MTVSSWASRPAEGRNRLAGTHDLLRIKLNAQDDSAEEEPHIALVPFAREIVPAVDRSSRVLEIDPPEGLLNIRELLKSSTTKASTTKKRQRRKSPKAKTLSHKEVLQPLSTDLRTM